jgi:hypothetical protein
VNEELKIIIKAVTEQAQKEINEVKSSLGDLEKSGGKSSKSFGTAMKGLGAAAGIAAAAAVAAFTAISAALVALGNNTKQFREEQARLNAAFIAAGSTAAQASETYFNLFRFMGDSDTASEAAAHLAKLTTNQKELAEWTTAAQGIYATFGKSLPIEGLTEAANETAKVGKVTGTLADALNWAGVSEDEFNASLLTANSEQERQALIRNTLNGLYADAARLYEENNAEIIASNEAQARLDATTGRLGKTVQPLLTALTNLSNVALTALEPAINAVAKAFTWFINIISKALSYVTSFISALTGKKATVQVAEGITQAASGAGKLTGNLNAATGAAEKLKRSTMGFDELNVVASDSGSSGGGGGSTGGGAGAGAGTIGGGFALDTGLNDSLVETAINLDKFKAAWEKVGEKLKEDYSPTIEALGGAFEQVKQAVVDSAPQFQNGLQSIKDGFLYTGDYVVNEFTPNITNSFSENILPMISDTLSVAIDEAGKDFEFFGDVYKKVSEDVIVPALESIETVTTDTMEGIGKAWEEHGQPFMDEYQEATEGMRDSTNDFYDNCFEPVWSEIKEDFDAIWSESLKPLWDKFTSAIGSIGTDLLTLWNEVFKPLLDWVASKLYPVIRENTDKMGDKIREVVRAISKILGGLIDTLKGLVSFITGVLTLDWRKAWDGIKTIFKGTWDTFVGIVQIRANKIIDSVNKVLKGLTSAFNAIVRTLNKISIDIPTWVPKYGGEKFGFNLKEASAPQLPRLATGGFVTGETLARIGEGGKKEVVLPLEQNTQWVDMLAAKLQQNTPTKIVLMLDKHELGWANIKSINGITQQTGNLQLKLV